MLNNFFEINFPYGITRNEKGEWMAFNRQYSPLGINVPNEIIDPELSYSNQNAFTNYGKISEKTFSKLADKEKYIKRNEKGEIVKVLLYDEKTVPVLSNVNRPKLWEAYFLKLRILSTLKVKNR